MNVVKISPLAVFLAAVVTAFFVQSGPVHAIPSLQTAFVAHYPDTRGTRLDNCTTCHMPSVKDCLNSYGLALKEAKMDFAKVEDIDSDEDGTPNGEEIKNERYPGSHATDAEYFIFHVNFSDEDPEMGKVHFNHEMHAIKDSMLSKGRCNNCHGKDLFPRRFNDSISVRPLAHQLCWRCHETSGSKLAPKDCTDCHTGIEEIAEELKGLLE